MQITLVRHGQSEANAGLTEHLDSALTPLGVRQAELTAPALCQAGLTQAYVSPLRRTLQTIAPFCAQSGLKAEVYADICEYFSAHWPGYRNFPACPPDEITTQFPFAFSVRPSRAVCPGGRKPEDDAIMYARACRVRDALLALHGSTDDHLLIVSHAETVGRLTEAFLHVPAVTPEPPWSDNCGITRMLVTDPTQPAEMISQNDVSHLTSLEPHAS